MPQVILPSQISTTSLGQPQTVPVLGERVMVTSTPTTGTKNKIINGNFDIWTRATSFSTPAANSFIVDRWNVGYDGSIGTFTVSQQTFPQGQTDVPGEPTYFLRWDQTVAGSGSTARILTQKIESVRTLAGQVATFSFWAKADSPRSIFPTMWQQFGTGGSATMVTNGQPWNITTTWQKFAQVLNIPPITGKTIAGGNDYLAMYFSLPINTTMTIDIAQVQLEAGATDTAFEILPVYKTLRMCQRYYEEVPANNITVTDHTSTIGGAVSQNLGYQVLKRGAPTITAPSWSLTQCNTPVIDSVTTSTFRVYGTATTSGGTHAFSNTTNCKIDSEL